MAIELVNMFYLIFKVLIREEEECFPFYYDKLSSLVDFTGRVCDV